VRSHGPLGGLAPLLHASLIGCDGFQFVEHLEGDGAEVFKAACRLGLEGIVSKRADSTYKGPAWQNHLTDIDNELRKSIDESLKRKHGNIVRLQSHDVPEWFGDGWWVSFEVPKRAGELMPVVRVAFFRNENSKAVLVKELVVRDADGSYPSWRSINDFVSRFES
jgi:hypothetical protein